jgi:hypothetical protein
MRRVHIYTYTKICVLISLAAGDLDRVKAIGGGGVDLTIGSALDIFGMSS